jgi:hypothetical protein
VERADPGRLSYHLLMLTARNLVRRNLNRNMMVAMSRNKS